MEKKMRQLFDYQKFARNPRLDAMLAETEERCNALDDDDLGNVSAAGDPLVGNHMMTAGNVGALMVEDLPASGDTP